jgi:hypothetical protein
MTHKDIIIDSDAFFEIDINTRQIQNKTPSKITLMQNDHNSERFTFSIARYVEGHDMAESTKAEVHYINTDGANKSSGVYPIDDLRVDEADDSKVVCSWLISRAATKYSGSLTFLVRFICLDEDGTTITYAWSTAEYSALSIGKGMDNSGTIQTNYSDVIERWKLSMTEQIRDMVAENFIENTAEGTVITVNDAAERKPLALNLYGKTKQTMTTGKNLIPFPYYDGKTKTLNGITFTQNDDGGVTINGTATAKTTYALMSDYNFASNFISSGTYTISTGSDIASDRTVFVQAKIDYNNKANYVYFQDMGTIKSTTIPDDVTDAHITIVNVVVCAGYTAENITIYPMLEKGATATKYEPYTGGKPTPSLEHPQALNSLVTNKKINVELYDETDTKYQSYTAPTSTGFPGVPVTEGGNYTDENGQQWVCDEIDLARGVYIKRIGETTMPSFVYVGLVYGTQFGDLYEGQSLASIDGKATGALCEVAQYATVHDDASKSVIMLSPTIGVEDQYCDVTVRGIAESEADFRAKTEGKKILYVLTEPRETALPQGYKELCMNHPQTTIVNDAGAHMVLEYVADPKAYIDNKIADLEKAILSAAT